MQLDMLFAREEIEMFGAREKMLIGIFSIENRC
jgi:hypothetical protein